MKNICLFLLLSLTSCSSCAHENVPPPCDGSVCQDPTIPDVSSTPNPTDQVVTGTGWTLTVPEGWVETSPDPDILNVAAMYLNQDKKSLILIIAEDFPGSSNEYTLEVIRGYKDAGAHLNSAIQVELNGEKFILLDTLKDGVQSWVWVTTKHGVGYSLACGAPREDGWESFCQKVANSFKLL